MPATKSARVRNLLTIAHSSLTAVGGKQILSVFKDNSICRDNSMSPFVSFAQNYEDVILWRALRHIENGFFVDCGAYDPTCHSVTKAFYDRGWTGINIEPIRSLAQKFANQRPLDINLNIALSDNSVGANFYEV